MTTLVYSGHARTLSFCFPNHWAMVLRHLGEIRIVASLVDDAAGRLAQSVFEKRIAPDRLHIELVQQPEMPFAERESAHAPFALSVPQEAVWGQLWHLQRAFAFAGECNRTEGQYIRIRPDIFFHETPFRFDRPRLQDREAIVPHWGSFGGVNDRFAVLGRSAAKGYFNALTQWESGGNRLGVPFHPESIVADSLMGCDVSRQAIMFSTIREDGEHRDPEIFPWEQPTNKQL